MTDAERRPPLSVILTKAAPFDFAQGRLREETFTTGATSVMQLSCTGRGLVRQRPRLTLC